MIEPKTFMGLPIVESDNLPELKKVADQIVFGSSDNVVQLIRDQAFEKLWSNEEFQKDLKKWIKEQLHGEGTNGTN